MDCSFYGIICRFGLTVYDHWSIPNDTNFQKVFDNLSQKYYCVIN